MKRIVLIIIWLCAILWGCDVSGPLPRSTEDGDIVRLELIPQYGRPDTRSGHHPDPDPPEPQDFIRDGLILEFNGAGHLMERLAFEGDQPPAIQVRKNQETHIYVVANPTVDLSGINTFSEFLSFRSSYAAMARDRLEMTGRITGTFTSDAQVNVQMERMVSGIRVGGMSVKIYRDEKYTSVQFTRANMEKTPATCGYDLSLTGDYVNAYNKGIEAGYVSSFGSIDKSVQGDWTAFDFNTPWWVYCYPNPSEVQEERNVLAISYRLGYIVTGTDSETGDTVYMQRWDDSVVRLVLPPLRPNTVYELEKLTLYGFKYRTVYLKSGGDMVNEPLKCVFRMTDMTSGEYLGSEEGEVLYE